jgi:hypothetical protein
VRRRAGHQGEIHQASIRGDGADIMGRMGRRRDDHIVGEAQRQVVGFAGLLIRHALVELEDEPSEPWMIADPRLDRR